MNQILSLLWNETMEDIKTNDEYENRCAIKEEAYKELYKRLNDEDKKLFTKYVSLAGNTEFTANEIYFTEGAKAGIRFIIDCLSDE